MIRIMFLMFCLPLFSQVYTGPWQAARPYMEQPNAIGMEWESVAGATSFEFSIIEWKDSQGWFPLDKTDGWQRINGNTAIQVAVKDSSAIISNLTDDRRYFVRIRAVNATEAGYNDWSYPVPFRTGLFPVETLEYPANDYVILPEPPAGDFSWRETAYGTHERRVSDRVRDGNIKGISRDYPKVQSSVQFYDPESGSVNSGYTWTKTKYYDMNTYLPTTLEVNAQHFPPLYRRWKALPILFRSTGEVVRQRKEVDCTNT